MAPVEKGTLGLFVKLSVELPSNEVKNEPAKKRLCRVVFVVMDSTRDPAPDRPEKGGADQEDALVSHTATSDPGKEKVPPTHTFELSASQNTDRTSPLGPPDPIAANPDLEVYDATFAAEVPPIDENVPAT